MIELFFSDMLFLLSFTFYHEKVFTYLNTLKSYETFQSRKDKLIINLLENSLVIPLLSNSSIKVSRKKVKEGIYMAFPTTETYRSYLQHEDIARQSQQKRDRVNLGKT